MDNQHRYRSWITGLILGVAAVASWAWLFAVERSGPDWFPIIPILIFAFAGAYCYCLLRQARTGVRVRLWGRSDDIPDYEAGAASAVMIVVMMSALDEPQMLGGVIGVGIAMVVMEVVSPSSPPARAPRFM